MRITKPQAERATPSPRIITIPGSFSGTAEWIIRRELFWLALLSPALLFPDRRWAWLIIFIPALWLVRFAARGLFLPRTPLDWPIAALVAMVAVSIFATFSIAYSLPKITGLLLGIAVYYALVEWITSEPEKPGRRTSALALSIWTFLAAGAALSIVGLFGTNWLDKMEGLSDVTRGLPRVVPGLPGAENGFQPNEVAGTLLLVALPAFAMVVWSLTSRFSRQLSVVSCQNYPSSSDNRQQTTAYSVLLLIIVATLLLTQSRGALLGAAVGAALILWVSIPRLRIWLLATAAGALLAFALNDPVSLVNKLLQPVVPSILTTDPANVRVRLDIWSSAIAAIRDAPLTGIGMNTFRQIMPQRYPSAIIPTGYDVAHAHNVFLQVALDLGLPGLLAYVAICVIAFVLLVRAFRVAPTGWHKAVAAGIGAGLLAFLIFGITDTVALGAKPGIFFWALLGLDVALWTKCTTTQSQALNTQNSQS